MEDHFPESPNVEPSVDVEPSTEREVEVPGKKMRSRVWNHFTKEKQGDKMKAICNHCKKILGGESKNGTKHLLDHLEKFCSKLNVINSGQKVLTNMLKNDKLQMMPYSFDQDFARKQLACMIVMHEYPLSIVDHVGFRRYSSALQPSFRLVSRNTIKDDILKLYESEKAKTMKLLKANRSRVAITTDMWTATNQQRGFMVITTHFIDDSWQLHSRIIRYALNFHIIFQISY
ncbi:hypothetical protein Dimus_038811 [Dionaea muscipula]